jgi:hypothetical protein
MNLQKKKEKNILILSGNSSKTEHNDHIRPVRICSRYIDLTVSLQKLLNERIRYKGYRMGFESHAH